MNQTRPEIVDLAPEAKSNPVVNPLSTLAAALIALSGAANADIIVGFETTGQTTWGTQNLPATSPSYSDPDVTIGGLTRGAGFATTNTAVANAWGGHGIEGPTTVADAVTAENYVTFTVTPSATFEFSASALTLHYRRSSTGPNNLGLQYQVGAGSFVDIGSFELTSTSSGGASIDDIDLSSIAELQQVPAGTTVTFRAVPYGATDPSGVFYFYGPIPGFDVELNGSVQTIGSTGDTDPPRVAALTPADDSNSTTVDGASKLRILFNEDVTLGSGDIIVHNFTTGAAVATIPADFDHIELTENIVDIALPAPLTAGASYYVTIPSGAFLDLADPSNAFPGITGTAGSTASQWNFTIAAAGAAPTVVVNEYVNSTPEKIELLVVGNQVAGTTVDMRGMILKDFSSSMGNDGGGGFTFSTSTVWSAVPVGTLIVLTTATATSSDTNAADFLMNVGLTDPALFSAAGASFDISATEMVMIKAAGSGFAGVTGGIHALAAGNAGAQYTAFTGAKLRAATATSGASPGVYANNATSTLADYSDSTGTGATSPVTVANGTVGAANNGTNAAYIAQLRGLVLGDGDGIASTLNVTPASPFNGLGMFDKGVSGQSVKVTLNAQISGVTLSDVRIVVPASLGTPTTATLGGAGAGSGSASIAGSTITISGVAVTTANALEVTINGLTTPTPTLVTDNGNYALTVSTRASTGSLTPIGTQPAVRVIIPIASLRDVDANGVALDNGATVAIEGVVTEAEFGTGTSNYMAYLQDSTAGINLFSATLNPNLVRGTRYAILGSVLQFNGLTEITATSIANIVNRGVDTDPTPEVVTLATLFAAPETYEGKLIKVQNLSFVSGTWAANAETVLKDSTPTNISLYLQPGSTANVAPASYPVDVTGVFGQRDTASPFNTGYQLMPRDVADVVASVAGSDYDTWASSPTGGAGGGTADPDGDGKDNAFEYAFGLNASAGGSVNPFAAPLSPATAKFRYTRRLQSLTGLTYKVFTSGTLQAASWVEDTTAVQSVVGTSGEVETVEVTLSAPAPLTASKLFLRVIAE